MKKTFFPFIVSRLHRPTLCQCEKHGWRPHALFGNPCGIYCFPLLSSTPSFLPVMASRGHGIVQALKKPEGGVDECFFLAGRSPDAKKARIAPRLLLLASPSHSLGRNRRIVWRKFDSDTRLARIPCRFSRAPAANEGGCVSTSPHVFRCFQYVDFYIF